MRNFTTISVCRLCESPRLRLVLDFGETALANAYPSSHDEPEKAYPLSVMQCDHCGHVQLEQTVDPKVLFGHYLYSSSDSPALVAHFKDFAEEVVRNVGFRTAANILEIGCNDGGLLMEFKRLGFRNLFGVEPAENIAPKASANGLTVFNEFLTIDLAKRIRKAHGSMDLICATNVFAHIANMRELMGAIGELLSDGGVFVFENAYLLDTIQGGYFDQFYHEHLQYYAVKPLVRFMVQSGLEVFDVVHTPAQGGSIRVFVQWYTGKRPVGLAVENWVEVEDDAKLYDDQTYARFNSNLRDFVLRFGNMMAEWRSTPATFSCYGCPAKFTLMSKLLGLDRNIIQYVVDDSPIKQGRFTPGQKIPIVSGTHFRLHPTDYCIVTAWNMMEAIVKRNPHYRGQWVNPYLGRYMPRPACNCEESGVKTG